MTGPEHYLESEEFLRIAEVSQFGSPTERYALDAAQAHATLALAAAQSQSAMYTASPEWRAVLQPGEESRG